MPKLKTLNIGGTLYGFNAGRLDNTAAIGSEEIPIYFGADGVPHVTGLDSRVMSEALNGIRVSVGLNENFDLTDLEAATYIHDASSVQQALMILDASIKSLSDTPYHLYIGSVNTAANNTVASAPYLKLFKDSTLQSQLKLMGSGFTTVSSTAADPPYVTIDTSISGLSNGTALGGVNIPVYWNGTSFVVCNNMTVPTATYNTLGKMMTVKSYSNGTAALRSGSFSQDSTTTAVTVEAPTTTSNRYYGVEADKTGRAFVNVPWTDTDTTYNVFGVSGPGHSSGLVPDPGATAGATKYLREDGAWMVPSSSSGNGSGTSAISIFDPGASQTGHTLIAGAFYNLYQEPASNDVKITITRCVPLTGNAHLSGGYIVYRLAAYLAAHGFSSGQLVFETIGTGDYGDYVTFLDYGQFTEDPYSLTWNTSDEIVLYYICNCSHIDFVGFNDYSVSPDPDYYGAGCKFGYGYAGVDAHIRAQVSGTSISGNSRYWQRYTFVLTGLTCNSSATAVEVASSSNINGQMSGLKDPLFNSMNVTVRQETYIHASNEYSIIDR